MQVKKRNNYQRLVKTSAPLRGHHHLESVSCESAHRSSDLVVLWLHLKLEAEHENVEESPHGTGFVSMKESWRAAEAWHCVLGSQSP